MDRLYVCSNDRNCYASEVSLLIERTVGKNGFGQFFSNEDASVKYLDIKFSGIVDSRTMTMFTGDIEIKMRGWKDIAFISKSRYEAQKEQYSNAKLVMFIHDNNIIEAANDFLDKEQSKDSNTYDSVYNLLSAYHIEELYGNYGSHGRKNVDFNFMNRLADCMLETPIDREQFLQSSSKCDSVFIMKLENEDFPLASVVCSKAPLTELAEGELQKKFNHTMFVTRQENENAPLVEIYKKDIGRVFVGYIDNQYALTQAAHLVGIRHGY
ncbi:hypothetical protein OTK49_02970 [Vibrio coralliirubri]|uniref:hypothetical protein n=1 Tax=Vibrio coralliirubri TaxID=1516159 RepID=UPI0022850338|nr:hypothetical protein [Vibrio coralliirubri]MCY9861477.1 hypothetical protein [Vibrio coralliirubri]